MEDQIGKGTMLTMYLIASSVDMSSYFNCHQHMKLKLQAGNAKQGLWEEEISFPRPAGIAEKKKSGQALKHTSPSAGLKKTYYTKLNACSQQFLSLVSYT